MKNPSTDNNFEVRAIELKNKILKEGLGNPNLIAECTDEEVLHLENKLDISLPESYKIFLRHFGHGLGGLIMNDITIRYQDIQDLTNLIRTEILIYRESLPGKFGVGRGKTVGFKTTVDGVIKVYRVDYDPIKGPHINVEIGKGRARKKLAVEFPGTEADVDAILRGLQ